MRRITLKSIALTLMMTITASVTPLQVSAQDQSSLQQNQNDLRQMQSDLHGLTTQLQTTMGQAEQLEYQVSDLLFQSKAKQQEIDKTQAEFKQRQALFKDRLKIMYQDGDVSYLDVLLNSKDFSDFLDRFSMLTLIVEKDQELVNELHNENQQLVQEQAQLKAQQQEMESKQQQLLALENVLQQKMSDKNAQIASKETEIQQQQAAQAEEQRREQEAALLQQQQAQQQAQQQTQQQTQQQSQATQPPLLASRGDNLTTAPSGSSLEMVATAYTAPTHALTASGSQVGTGTVAVDPSVIPLGTKLYIEGYGYAVASDTGLDIKGNRIDLFFNSVDQCILFGRRVVKVYRVS